MNVIYGGNTIGDLSRNMLLGQEIEDARSAARADEALRSRALNNQLAMANQDDRYRYADLGFRREGMAQQGRQFDDELGFRLFQHSNPSAADKSKNNLAELQFMLERERVKNAETQANAMLALERDKLGLGLVGLLGGSGYPTGKVGDEMRIGDYRLNQDAEMAANALNARLGSRLSTIPDRLDSGSDYGIGWLNPGLSKDEASKAYAHLSGLKTKDANGDEVDAALPDGVAGTGTYMGTMDWIRKQPGEIIASIPPESSGLVNIDYSGRLPKFVPRRFGAVGNNSSTTSPILENFLKDRMGSLLGSSAAPTAQAPVTPSQSSNRLQSMFNQIRGSGGVPIIKDGVVYSKNPDGTITPVGEAN